MYEFSFWVLAILSVGAALGMLWTRNLFRAALLLIFCFFTIAGIYVMLNADFLAAAQVLVYVGAVTILIVLAIMLTKDLRQGNFPNRLRLSSFIVSALVLVVLVWAVTATPWRISTAAPVEATTAPLGIQLFSETGYLLPVEIASLLILASVVGAIALMREK